MNKWEKTLICFLMLSIVGFPVLAEPIEIVIEYSMYVENITVYRGDTVTMQQLIATKTLDEDTSDGHLLYLYGAYQIESDSQPLTQIHTSVYPSPTITHQFNNLGLINYTVVIMYAEAQFNYSTGQWVLINSGVDVSKTQTYDVIQVPAPAFDWFLNLLNLLKSILCALFSWLGIC